MLGHLGEVFPEANVGHNFSEVTMRSLWFTWYKYYETINIILVGGSGKLERAM